jgi:hypothetical protein
MQIDVSVLRFAQMLRDAATHVNAYDSASRLIAEAPPGRDALQTNRG